MAKSSGRSQVYEDLSNVEFETSEDVEVVEKFKHMHLKEELIRGIFAYGKYTIVNSKTRSLLYLTLLSRLRETVRDPTACYQAHNQRTRRDCTGPIRHRKDGHLLHIHLTNYRLNDA